VAGREWRRGVYQTDWFLFGAHRASARATARAAAKRRPTRKGRSGIMGRSSDY